MPHYSLVNLLLEKGVIPELIQDALTPPRLAEEVLAYLDSQERSEVTVRELKALRTVLGKNAASERAAEAVLAWL